MRQNRYPWLFIRSKTELARHISHTGFSRERTLRLINDVLANFDAYWKDSSHSEPDKGKYVRSAKGKPLGLLLDKVNKKVLAPHDRLLPDFIFGGIKSSSHVMAAEHLLGHKRKRVLLKLDIKRFFEQIKQERVAALFQHKCGCSPKAAKLLSALCCVPVGAKGLGGTEKTIARGFATSSRLAVWCNLDLFLRLDWLVQERLKGKDPRIAIYVDDIGITASRVPKGQMDLLFNEVRELLMNADKNQPLPLNLEKKKIISHEEGMELLGLALHRNRLAIGRKTLSKRNKLKEKLKRNLSPWERSRLRRKYVSLNHYKRHVENGTGL